MEPCDTTEDVLVELTLRGIRGRVDALDDVGLAPDAVAAAVPG